MQVQYQDRIYLVTLQVTVTTRIITCLVGDSNLNLQYTTEILGSGAQCPMYTQKILRLKANAIYIYINIRYHKLSYIYLYA